MEQENNTAIKGPGVHVTIGNIVALLMLAFALIAGGAFVLQSNSAPQVATAPAADNAAVDTATVALSQQGTSDEVTAIEQDLKATDLGSLDDVSKI